MDEELTMRALAAALPFLRDRVYSPGPLRVFTDWMTPEELPEAARLAHDELDFTRGMHVIGTDEGGDLGFSYLLTGESGVILVLRAKAPKADPRIHSLTGLYPAMLLHERELADLFGAVVEDLPAGQSYPLPDDWPAGQYPMRKEWDPRYFDRETMTYAPPARPEGPEEKTT